MAKKKEPVARLLSSSNQCKNKFCVEKQEDCGSYYKTKSKIFNNKVLNSFEKKIKPKYSKNYNCKKHEVHSFNGFINILYHILTKKASGDGDF